MEREYADPPGMPDDERMDPAELRVVREYLGLPGEWLSDRLGVQGRTFRRWEAGTSLIPDGVRVEIEAIEADTAARVNAAVDDLAGRADPAVVVYRTDEEFQEATGLDYPASWHRALVGRVAEDVPRLVITYG